MNIIKQSLILLVFTSTILSCNNNKLDHNRNIKIEFPLPRVHTGVVLANGVQGLMVWGQGNQLNLTVGRAGFWDHRGGYRLGNTITYKKLKELLLSGRFDEVKAAFAPEKQEDKPKIPFQMGGGRLEMIFPVEFELTQANLDIETASLEVDIVNKKSGDSYSIRIHQAFFKEVAWVELPKKLKNEQIHLRLVPSFDNAEVQENLAAINATINPPTTWEYKENIHGFTQELPKDPSLSLAYELNDQLITIISNVSKNATDSVKAQFETLDVKKEQKHTQRWWKDFWKDVALVDIPDKKLQEMYYYNLYKLASCTPPHGLPCSLQGPLMEDTRIPPWSNDYHFNINIEMIYQPLLAANKPEHYSPLWDMFLQGMPMMQKDGEAFFNTKGAIIVPHAVDDRGQVVGSFWTGSIDQACAAWMAQLAWLHYRYTMDEEILKDIAFPLMKGAFEGYYAMTEKRTDSAGRLLLRLPVTVSPEYKGKRFDAWGADASFQLAAFKMTAKNLIRAAMKLEIPVDPRWVETVQLLPDYTTVKTPLSIEYSDYLKERIALWEGQGLEESHRHHSHLASVYPFKTINPDDSIHSIILNNSFLQWVRNGRGNWSGWSFPWASSLHAHVGNIDAAVSLLHDWMNNFTNSGRNSLHDADFPGISAIYGNNWNKVPFMDKNREIMQLDAAFGFLDAIYTIMIREKNGTIYILPQIPRDWKSFSFTNIRTEGAFLISANVENRIIKDIIILSLAGETIRLAHNMGTEFFANGDKLQGDIFERKMRKGERVRLENCFFKIK